jgi:hypothetical protein
MIRSGLESDAHGLVVRGSLNILFIAVIFACVAVVLTAAVRAWLAACVTAAAPGP